MQMKNKKMSRSCFDLIIFFLCAFLMINFNLTTTTTTTAQPQPAPFYILHICQGANYTNNSPYQDNLNSLLFTLSLSTIRKLDKKYVGSYPNTVYGLLQCRGDLSNEDCRNCVDTATKEITSDQRCPSSKQAIIWYDECMLRYSDRSFFSVLQDFPSISLINTANISNPDRFNPILAGLLRALRYKAVSGYANRSTYFATGERNVTNMERVYGIVQCTVDLNPSNCDMCLQRIFAQLSACCDGKQGGRRITPSCYFRYEIYPFIQNKERDANPPPPPPPLSLTPPLPRSPDSPPSQNVGNENKTDQKNNKSSRVYIFTIPIVAAALVVIAFVISICLLRRKAIRERAYRLYQASVLHSEESSYKHNEIQRDEADVPFVDFDTILTATGNFSNSNKLGQGGFGPVYKGTFRGGHEMAVKRLSRSSGQGLEEFRNEVLLIAKLQHRNLVRLLGYCIKEEEKVLLYEYMPNKSLDTFIFDRTLCLLINWEKRLDIILGIARGILYLHQDSRLRIIHRDLKTSNVLLDEEMNPKISDFGLARICGGTQTEGSTNRVVGTYGYMAPEYALDGLFSVKSDVYSFGVVLLEILSGKKNSGFHVSEDSLSFISYAWRLWNENKVLDFIDKSLCEACKVDEVFKYIQVGLLCVQEDANDRPTMFTVIFMLGGEATSLPTPKKPALVFRRHQSSSTTTTSSSRPESCSRNEITVSAAEGR